MQKLILNCICRTCDTTKDEFIIEAIHLTLKTQAMYTTQHVHSIVQAAIAYQQAHSISDHDMEGSASKV
jgi:hypothetical protein